MTDLEMMKFAAKAAGIEVVCHGNDFFTAKNGISVDEWNPITDDGDALRLAVKLGEKYLCCVVGILNRSAFPHAYASVVHRVGSETYIEQDVEGDIAAATRLAIVRAAAEIGKAMP